MMPFGRLQSESSYTTSSVKEVRSDLVRVKENPDLY